MHDIDLTGILGRYIDLNINSSRSCLVYDKSFYEKQKNKNFKIYNFDENMLNSINTLLKCIYNENISFGIIEIHKEKKEKYIVVEDSIITIILSKNFIEINKEDAIYITNKINLYNGLSLYISPIHRRKDGIIPDFSSNIDVEYATIKIFNPLNLNDIENVIKKYEEIYDKLIILFNYNKTIVNQDASKHTKDSLDYLNYTLKKKETYSNEEYIKNILEKQRIKAKKKQEINLDKLNQKKTIATKYRGDVNVKDNNNEGVIEKTNKNIKSAWKQNLCSETMKIQFNSIYIKNILSNINSIITNIISMKDRGIWNVGIYALTYRDYIKYVSTMIFSDEAKDNYGIINNNFFVVNENELCVKRDIINMYNPRFYINNNEKSEEVISYFDSKDILKTFFNK